MLNEGKFPVLQEFGWGPFSKVHESSKLGDGTRLAVKTVCLSSEGALFADGMPAEQFRNAVLRQQGLASRGCSGLLPVVDFGVDESSGYYVTHRYDRSLKDWIVRRIQPSAEVLRRVADGCLEMLQALSEMDGAAHGNLKLSNVLCRGTVSELEVAFTDVGVSGTVKEDLEALGKILYQLVARREIAQVDWPLAESNEWSFLKREAEDWRTFCNRLLDQSPEGRFQSLTQARAYVPRPGRRKALSLRILLPVGAVLLLGGLAIVFFPRVSQPPESPVAVQEWHSLCEANSSWFGDLSTKPGWQKRWDKNPFLNKQLLVPLQKLSDDKPLRDSFNLRAIVDPSRRAEHRELKQFATDLPGLSRESLHQVRLTMQAVSLIQDSLENWRRTELTALLGEFKKAGGQSSALEAASPIPWNDGLAGWVDAHLVLQHGWNQWKQQAARLHALKDPFFEAASALTIRELEQAGEVSEIGMHLESSAAVLKEWADYLSQHGDHFEPAQFRDLLKKFEAKPLNADVLKQLVTAVSSILEKPAQWLAELNNWNGAKRSAALRAAWKTRKEAALSGVTAAGLEKDRPKFRALKVQLERLDFVLNAVDEGLPSFSLPPGLSDTAPGPTLLKTAAALREETAAQLAASLPPTEVLERVNPLSAAPGLEMGRALARNYEALGGFPDHFQRLSALFNEGASLEAGVAEAAEKLQNLLRSGPVFQPLLAAPEVSRLVALSEELRQVAAADAAQLAAKIQSPAVSVAFSALVRRSELLPAKSLADWRAHRNQCAAVLAKVQASVLPPEKRVPLAEKLTALQAKQWTSALHSCPKEELLELAEQRAEAGISETQLSAADRYNILLLRKQALLAANKAVDVAELRDGLVREVEKLAGFSDAEKTQADRFLTELRAFSFSANRKTAQSERGPGQRGWRSNPDSPETLSWQGHTLRMVRVENGNGTSFFLANKAVSVGLVADWIKRADSRAPVLPVPPSNRIPSVWTGSGRNITPADDWFGSFTTAQFPKTAHYPEGFSAGSRPQNDTPMVYLSAENAGALAKDMGFRLPTENEWRRALEQAHVRDVALSNFNLRDATWNQEQEYLKNYSTSHALDGRPAAVAWLDGAIFRPDPTSAIRAGRQNAVPVHSGRDGFLWFAPVQQGGETGGFFHLLGNVAHYVTKGGGEENYLVVGSSALSEPGATNASYTVAKAGVGFADVGFRLALDADFFENPEVTRFKEALRKTALLTRAKD